MFACAGKTEPPSRLILSQTSAGKVFGLRHRGLLIWRSSSDARQLGRLGGHVGDRPNSSCLAVAFRQLINFDYVHCETLPFLCTFSFKKCCSTSFKRKNIISEITLHLLHQKGGAQGQTSALIHFENRLISYIHLTTLIFDKPLVSNKIYEQNTKTLFNHHDDQRGLFEQVLFSRFSSLQC